MRWVPFAGREASVLGFGCANLMGRHGRRASLRALHAAFDSGVNYFDVARSYGYGHAERLLGEFLSGRRDHCVVATKFGILPPTETLLRSVARPLVRTGLALAKRTGLGSVDRLLRKGIAKGAGASVARGQFSPALARASLDTSLRELGCENVDILWLHACGPDDLTDELRATLDGFVAAGKILHYGPATDPVSCRTILDRHPDISIAQVPHNAWDDSLSATGGRPTAVHSVLGTPDQRARLRTLAASDPRTGDPETFALRYALGTNPTGVVVLGMAHPRHIAANVAVADAPPADSATLNEVAAAIRAGVNP
jgi:aryl-alcohol dehydrogenase-like predicted oxidoreductase